MGVKVHSERVDAAKSHLRQLLMSLYQVALAEGYNPDYARRIVRNCIQEALTEWDGGEAITPTVLSPLPLVHKALAEAEKLGPSARPLKCILIDLQHALGGNPNG